MLHVMGEQDSGRSPELDEVRRILFPLLSTEEGWANIDRAIRGAADGERWAAIEEAAKGRPLTDEEWAAIEDAARQQNLSADLLERLHQAREKDRE
jgi:hypothetical protein